MSSETIFDMPIITTHDVIAITAPLVSLLDEHTIRPAWDRGRIIRGIVDCPGVTRET